MATNTIALSLAKETRSSPTVNANRTCFKRRSKENKYNDSTSDLVDSVCTLVEPIHYGGESWEQELLQLWGFRHMERNCRNRETEGRIGEERIQK